MSDRADAGVLVDAENGLLRVVIDRPERKGSLDVAAIRRLVAALESAATDDTLRAVLLTSSGRISRSWPSTTSSRW